MLKTVAIRPFCGRAALCASLFAALAAGASPAWSAPMPSDAGAVVTLPGSASVTLKNDEATIVFTAESQKPDARAAQAEVTQAADKALAALAAFDQEAVVAETTGLSTWPVYRKAKEGEVATVGAWGVRDWALEGELDFGEMLEHAISERAAGLTPVPDEVIAVRLGAAATPNKKPVRLTHRLVHLFKAPAGENPQALIRLEATVSS